MKSLCLILGLTLFPNAVQAAPADERPLRTDGAFFALSVADLPSSVRWYTEKLGLAVSMEVPAQNGIAVTVVEGGGLVVELIHNDRARPLREAAPGVTDPQLVHGLFKAGILVKDFDRTVARLASRGVEIAFGPFPARDGRRANVLIRDNSGNLLQIFGD